MALQSRYQIAYSKLPPESRVEKTQKEIRPVLTPIKFSRSEPRTNLSIFSQFSMG